MFKLILRCFDDATGWENRFWPRLKMIGLVSIVLVAAIVSFGYGGGGGGRDFRETANDLNLEMVFVRGGTFSMGCTPEQGDDCDDNEKPVHQVTLSNFHIGKYPVTQKQWAIVMGTTVTQQRDKIDTCWGLAGVGDNYPMYYVSWDETQEFLNRLNLLTGKQFRLLTEAEWEFAARGGNSSRGFKYSGGNNIDAVAWHIGNSDETTHPVGEKTPNELGIHDMSGNVWEWVNDWYGSYTSDAKTNPTGPTRVSDSVVRGGGWRNLARFCRVSNRYYFFPDNRDYFIGFRLALSSP